MPSKKASTSASKKSDSASKAKPEVKKVLGKVKPLLPKRGNPPSLAACKEARETIAKLVFAEPPKENLTSTDALSLILSFKLSLRTLPGYATLDTNHIKQIRQAIAAMEEYIDDTSQKRPLNIMMLAAPGAGKSHFINCIGKHLARRGIRPVTFNMAGMQWNEDLGPALDAARNVKVEDKLPLLFLDEFDASVQYYSLLLPLLWDGGLNLGQRDLRLGKAIIVLAGSKRQLPKEMEIARSMSIQSETPTETDPKSIDLFSRINGGVLRIPRFQDAAKNIDRRADKVCVAVSLLRRRFGSTLERVPLALLRFISQSEFRYGARSIAQLVDLIPHKNKAQQISLKDLGLPLANPSQLKESPLAYHLQHEDQAFGIVKVWDEASTTKASAYIASSLLDVVYSMDQTLLEHYMPRLLDSLG